MLIMAYSSVIVLLSASAPVKTWLYGSDSRADTISARGTIAKNLLMICASVLILVLTHFNNLNVLIPLTVLVYWTGKKLVALQKQRAFRFCRPMIIFLVVFFCYYKYSSIQLLLNPVIGDILNLQGPENLVKSMAVSLFIFKAIDFLIVCYKKRIKNLDFLTFLNYILFFPSFFTGPVNRYNRFSEDIYNSSVSIDRIGGIRRIIEGLFKKVILCRFLMPYCLTNIDLANPSLTRTQAILGIYACVLYFYCAGSGYADIAIGNGKLLGINLPENFNHPFFKKNLQQFWANWNMSVTSWLMDYVYWPLVGKARDIQKVRTRPILLSNICIILTFVVVGIWHEANIQFLLWGLYQGVGLTIFHFYAAFKRKHFSQKWKQHVTPSWYARTASTLLTFQFVAFGFLLFCCNSNQIGRLWHLFVL
jgi:D-alanyl-lipoteichoic acid acyltransferase DltB (MBOAT superfamily)